jgi:lambda family phage minor tail protein L
MDAQVSALVQTSAPGAQIELFDLDPTGIDPNQIIMRFFPGSNEAASLGSARWRGNVYQPYPIEVDGIDFSGKGTLPRPMIKVSNINGLITTLIRNLGGVGGIILTRWKTYRDFLDDGATPNPSGYLPVDIFVLDRIVTHNRMVVEIECRSVLDFERKKLPSRQMLQSACTHSYRVPNQTGGFVYTNVTCPYVGTAYFDAKGRSTTAASDQCGKKLGDCKLRFGTAPLPTRAFPGVGRY